MYLFAFTLFLSAVLLFTLQLMFARLVLPLLGGSPAVWNTCSVFFQAALLAGYAYAHASTSRLPVRRHIPVHILLLLVPLAVLPIRLLGGAPPREAAPIFWLLGLLTVSVGLPFLAVSTTSSVIQHWFSQSGDRRASDPYFLYASSNLGSLVGLAAYVAVLEPTLTLAQQRYAWSAAYFMLVVFIAACGWYTLRSAPPEIEAAPGSTAEPAGKPSFSRQVRWILLAFVPSSLMLGLTTFLTTDIAAVPLLWAIPLGLYLASFMLVFSRSRWQSGSLFALTLPVLVLIQAVVFARVKLPLTAMMPLHLTTFFFAAMACHGELARDRPPSRYLTSFYLMLSVGGVLGGAFNALVAPLLFDSVAEYPIALVLACAMVPGWRFWKRKQAAENRGDGNLPMVAALDVLWPLALAGLVLSLPFISRHLHIQSSNQNYAIVSGVIALICLLAIGRPIRFALGLGAVLLGMSVLTQRNSTVAYQERTFYGVLRITADPGRNFISLSHGTTLHGMQATAPALTRVPLTYYHPTGPIGQVFLSFKGQPKLQNVAVVGLGAGSLAGYTGKGQRMVFYEIDPAVVRIATDPRAFTFIPDALERGANVETVLGDARLRLEDARDGEYSLIVLDAFSSDSIPTHLVTREALQLYGQKLQPNGLIAFHVSNRLLDVQPVIALLARDAQLTAYSQSDYNVTDQEKAEGKTTSRWILLGRSKNAFGPIASDERWERLSTEIEGRVWTDDYSNILDVLRYHG